MQHHIWPLLSPIHPTERGTARAADRRAGVRWFYLLYRSGSRRLPPAPSGGASSVCLSGRPIWRGGPVLQSTHVDCLPRVRPPSAPGWVRLPAPPACRPPALLAWPASQRAALLRAVVQHAPRSVQRRPRAGRTGYFWRRGGHVRYSAGRLAGVAELGGMVVPEPASR